MSKLGKKTIVLPKDSSIKVDAGNLLISGPLGSKQFCIMKKFLLLK